MGAQDYAVFWSYAHQDDDLDGGRLLKLADHLRSEYALLTGNDLEMFVDRDGIAWGDEWRKRIDSALVQTSFLIPLVTPRYFTRPECRRELLAFHAQAQSRDLNELILPVLYIPVVDMTIENADEAVAIIARTQYVNWSDLRLSSVDSVEYRRQVNALAKRLAELVASVAETQLVREVERGVQDSVDDLEQLLERASDLWPDWLTAVEDAEVLFEQRFAIISAYHARWLKLNNRRAPMSDFLANYYREGQDELPLVKRQLALAEVYAARTIELDPIVTAIVRAARENPASAPLLEDLLSKSQEASSRLADGERKQQESHATADVYEFVKSMPVVSQTWKEIVRLSRQRDELAEGANSIVLRWVAELEAVLGVLATPLE